MGEDETDGKEEDEEGGDGGDDDIAEMDAVGAGEGPDDRSDLEVEDAAGDDPGEAGDRNQIEGIPEGEEDESFHGVSVGCTLAVLRVYGVSPDLRKMASPWRMRPDFGCSS